MVVAYKERIKMVYAPNPQSSDTKIIALVLAEILKQMTPTQQNAIKTALSSEANSMLNSGANGADARRLNEVAQEMGLGSLF
jgi:hypothetical protein